MLLRCMSPVMARLCRRPSGLGRRLSGDKLPTRAEFRQRDVTPGLKARGASLKATEQPIDTSTAAGKCFLLEPHVVDRGEPNKAHEKARHAHNGQHYKPRCRRSGEHYDAQRIVLSTTRTADGGHRAGEGQRGLCQQGSARIDRCHQGARDEGAGV